MLVLARKRGERVLIGSNMSVTVLDVQGGRVKLGFECPREVPVLREELQPEYSNPICVPALCGNESEFHSEFA